MKTDPMPHSNLCYTNQFWCNWNVKYVESIKQKYESFVEQIFQKSLIKKFINIYSVHWALQFSNSNSEK